MNRSVEVAPRRLVLPAVLALALAACQGQKGDRGDPGPAGPSGDAGVTGPQGAAGPGGADGKSSLTASTPEPAGTNCPTGGVRIDFGLDSDGNGVLDQPEMDLLRTQYLCAGPQGPAGATGGTGPTGANGKSSLAATASEAAGANCVTGGTRVEFGVDADGNGTLDSSEVDAALTRYICNGAQGPQGIPGTTGAAGADGKNSLSATAAEPPGASCATGGTRVDHGVDANGNGVLETAEVNVSLRRYICNGAQGPQGIPGSTGAQGTPGTLGAYGDGSAGALNIATNTDWSASFPGANLQYTDVNLSAGVTWTVPSGTIIRATGNVTIAGTINVLPGTTDNGQFRPAAGVAFGAATQQTAGIGLSRLASAHLVRIPVYGGGAGARNASCTGGEGGGSFAIYARGSLNVTAAGSINANGSNSVNLNTAGLGIPGGGGGSGGLIVLIGKSSLLMSGALRTNGGNGSSGFDGNGGNSEGGGGGGGGGIIHLLSSTSPSVTGTTATSGGTAGATAGGSTVVFAGGGGGACGGSGGVAGSNTTTPAGGAAGHVITSTLATPEALLL